jgi:hypothetical protein
MDEKAKLMERIEPVSVTLKNGKNLQYIRTHGTEHVFFENRMVVNTWMFALLVFILIVSILIGFFQVTLTTEATNRMLAAFQQEAAACNPGYLVYEPVSVGNENT